MAPTTIGFIGFGEVASVFSKAIREHGAGVFVTDVLLSQKGGKEILRSRMLTDGIRTGTLREVIEHSDYVLSTVTPQVAKKVAQDAKGFLGAGQIYVDLNSTSPTIKKGIAQVIARSSAHFVEGAVLGAVGATGTQTRILVAGDRGQETAAVLNEVGLNVSYYSHEVGKASMFKMLRSIFSKGVECLILELLVAGRRADILQDLWDDVMQFMAKNPFDRVASNWVCTHATAYERRYYEMLQVVETMTEIGIDPVMSSATRQFFERSLSLGLENRFKEKPSSKDEVVEAIEEAL